MAFSRTFGRSTVFVSFSSCRRLLTLTSRAPYVLNLCYVCVFSNSLKRSTRFELVAQPLPVLRSFSAHHLYLLRCLCLPWQASLYILLSDEVACLCHLKAFASSRREKIPFALLWLRFSAQAAAGSLAMLFSGVLLASHFEEVWQKYGK